MDKSYDDLERAMADSDSKYKMMTTVFNAKFGTETKEEFKRMGSFGKEERNERGDHLTELADEHKLIVANALFQKKKKKKKEEHKLICFKQKTKTTTTTTKTTKDSGLGRHPIGKQETK